MKDYLKILILLIIFLVIPTHLFAAPLPSANVNIGIDTSDNPQDLAVTLQVMALLTILSLAPAILIMTTAFVRIVVVLSFLRNALSIQNAPPSQVIIALSLFLTFYIMSPYWMQANQNGVQPFLKGDISQTEALDNVAAPIREFMFKQTRESDIALFVNLSQAERPETQDDVSTFTLIPAFIISELKTAFQIGFMIYIPFIVIDMIVASTLMSMGMMMLPPTMISLPFKVLLFVMVDGWHLLMNSLIVSFK